MASVLMSGELINDIDKFYYIYAKNSFKKFFNPVADWRGIFLWAKSLG
ncbi:MAG: hypothetical protein V1649_03835 [Patescibacteria group bacterium]